MADIAGEPAYQQFPFAHPMTEVMLQPIRYLGYAEDHLVALAGVIRAPGTILATFTLLRTLLVSAAFARFLSDPKVDTRERFRRGMNVQLETLTERMRMVGRSDPTWTEDQEKRQRIVGAARQAKWSVKAPSPGAAWPRDWVIEPAPSPGVLIDALLSDADDGRKLGQFFYRLMSAMSHAQLHGLLTMMDRSGAVSHGDGTASVPIRMDLQTLRLLAIAAVGGLTMAMDNCVAYYGWTPDSWQTRVMPVFQGLRNQLGLPLPE